MIFNPNIVFKLCLLSSVIAVSVATDEVPIKSNISDVFTNSLLHFSDSIYEVMFYVMYKR